MNYSDFLDIAHYANENWKGYFSEQELKDFAWDYFNAYKKAMVDGYIEMGSILDNLLEQLVEDYENSEGEELEDWLEHIAATTGFQDLYELIDTYHTSDGLSML